MDDTTWLLGLTLGSTVVLAAALALGLLLRGSSAAARHHLLTLAACGLLLLPALPRVLPRWEVRIVPPRMGVPSGKTEAPPVRTSDASPAVGEATLGEPERPAAGGRVEDFAQPPTRTAAAAGRIETPGIWFGRAAVGLWLLGVLANLLGLARALVRERRWLAAARPLDGPWLGSLLEARRSLAVTRSVRLMTSDEIQTPLTGGWRRPAILLPASAVLWPDERRRVVVQHELVHVLRSDTLRHLVWRLAVALYWFHPLARLAQRQASAASEQACDEAVLELGTRPSVYARHLLEIAESLRARPLVFANALPMVDRSQLERRLLMILDPNRSARSGRAIAAVCFAVLAGTVLGMGAALPVPLASSSSAAAADPKPSAPSRPREAAPVRALSEPGASACHDGMSGSFSGRLSYHDSSTNLIGEHDGDFALQQHLGDGRRLCARVHGPVRFDERDGSIRELPAGSSVLVEIRQGRTSSQRVLVTEESGARRYRWWIDGVSQPAAEGTENAAARAWLANALEVLAAYRAIGSIQGQVGSLQGQIGSIQGQVGSLQGQIGTVQGQIGSLQGRIGSIQGEQGSLQGAIGSHQGAIGGLQGARWRASDAQQARIDREIREHEAAIRKLEAEMGSRGIGRRIAEAEEELRAFEQTAQGRIGEIEQQVKDVRAEERISALEKQIEELHADERIREIEQRMKPALERLKADIDHLRR
jgi:beta-lactamase regulating signal transducer with metallopeptidase domain